MFADRRGLLWAEWRRMRKPLALGLTLQVGFIACILWRQSATDAGAREELAFWSFAVAVALLFVLLLSQSSSNEMRLSIPRRYYLLPMGTVQLVFWLFFHRLAVLLTTAGLATLAYAIAAARPEAWLMPMLGFVASFSVLQALVWIAPWVGNWSAYAFSVFALGPIVVFLYARFEPLLPNHTGRAIALCILCVTASFVLSCLGLRSIRSSGHTHGGGAAFRSVCAGFNFGRLRAFASEAQALTWFEWQDADANVTIFFSGLLLAMDGLLHSGGYFEATGGAENPFERQWTNGFFLLLSTAILARIWTGTRRISRLRRRPGGFLNRHPLDDSDLACGKIASAAYAVLTWFAVLVGGTVAMSALTQWLSSQSIAPILPPDPLWAFLPIMLVSAWIAYWEGWLIVVLCLGVFSVAWALEGFLPVTARYASVSSDHAFLLAIVLSAVTVAPSFAKGCRCGLFSVRVLSLFALAIGSIGCLSAYFFRACGFFETFDGPEFWAFCGALSLLTMSPFATAPLAVYRARHC